MDITFEGMEEVNSLLSEVAEVPQSEGVLTQAGAILLANTRRRFLSQKAPDGTTWPKSLAALLRETTPTTKCGSTVGTGGGTLFECGVLFHSISLRKPGPLKRAIYTDVPYAKSHQEGEDGQDQRVFLGFSSEDVQVIERLVRARLERII